MTYEDIWSLIKKYERIIVLRHSRPDLDALGSQIGLAQAISTNFPEKEVYMVGDPSSRYQFIGKMDEISDDLFNNSLAIICDVAVDYMICDDRYKLAKEVLVIDHHKNDCNIPGALTYIDTTKVACAELIGDMLRTLNKDITHYGATALYGGIVTDSGRFQYAGTSDITFKVASFLVTKGADMDFIYNHIYVETLAQRQMKNYFQNLFKVDEGSGVAYLKCTKEVLEPYKDVPFFDISRGMVNLMAGVEEVLIWCNFTYDSENDKVIGEFRSRGISIVEIAKKYGGGGHPFACGATLADFATADLVIADFKQLVKEEKEKSNGNL